MTRTALHLGKVCSLTSDSSNCQHPVAHLASSSGSVSGVFRPTFYIARRFQFLFPPPLVLPVESEHVMAQPGLFTWLVGVVLRLVKLLLRNMGSMR